ncbi:hypothetical protein [Neptuniibacter sp. QD34_54]|uniref:hypothetical protein n=1 Tax=Neptuniibacter sp. QD34_54 TaxID=3398208 RepID=UPI0039F4B64D
MTELLETLNLNNFGSWASIVGLILTLITFLMLFGIKKRFLFRSSVDDHMKKITEISSDISPLLKSYVENKNDIDELFALADVELRAMEKGASGDLLADIKSSRNVIKKYSSKLWFWVDKNEDSAREIKKRLSVVSAELYHHRKSLITGK